MGSEPTVERHTGLIDCFIGVDPGVEGAIVVLGRESELIGVHDIPVVKAKSRKEVLVRDLSAIFKTYFDKYGPEKVFVTLEKNTPRPRQNISGQCKLARICGIIEGIVSSSGVSYQIAHPRSWSKVMRDVEGDDVKARSMIAASRRWSELDLSKKKHHNRADAALIAEYGRIYHDTPYELKG